MYNRHSNSLCILSPWSLVNSCSYRKLHNAFFVRAGNRENLSATVYFVVIKHVVQKNYQPLHWSTPKNVSDQVQMHLFINNDWCAHVHYTAKYNCFQYKIPFQYISPHGQLDNLVIFILTKANTNLQVKKLQNNDFSTRSFTLDNAEVYCKWHSAAEAGGLRTTTKKG